MSVRLNKVLKEFNIGLNTAVEFLSKKGFSVDSDMNAKIGDEAYDAISAEFGTDKATKKVVSVKPQAPAKPKKPAPKPAPEEIKTVVPEDQKVSFKTVGKLDLDSLNGKKQEARVESKEAQVESQEAEVESQETQVDSQESRVESEAATAESQELIVERQESDVEDEGERRPQPEVFRQVKQQTIEGPKVLGSIDLSSINENTRPKKKSKEERKKEREEKQRQQQAATAGKKKRNRIQPNKVDVNAEAKKVVDDGRQSSEGSKGGGRSKRKGGSLLNKNNISDEEVAKEVKKTLARLQSKKAFASGAKYRREKRDQIREQMEQQATEEANESKTLKLTEFVTANELASMMNVPVTKVISTCMSIGMMISINQRMDAETINMVAEEFGFKTEYVSASVSEAVHEDEDEAEDLQPRDPIVTVMGHVDMVRPRCSTGYARVM